jgi:hypothetical protein
MSGLHADVGVAVFIDERTIDFPPRALDDGPLRHLDEAPRGHMRGNFGGAGLMNPKP